MGAYMEVDRVADMEVDMLADIDIDINMEIQLDERLGHGDWLIWPKLFRPKLTRLACLLSFASLFISWFPMPSNRLALARAILKKYLMEIKSNKFKLFF